MTEEECSLTNDFGQTVQVFLAFLVLIVLTLEFVCERLWAWWHSTIAKRDMIQFVYDVFKISCGAALSHLFNVLVSLYMSTHSARGNACAIYTIAYIYEGSGVCFVQLLMYCLIKFAESRSYVSMNWSIIAKPGEYNMTRGQLAQEFSLATTFWLRIFISFFLSGVSIWISISLGFSDAMTYVAPVFIFILCFTFLYTSYEAKLQTLAWVGIKTFEKVIWSLFAIAQTHYFIRWSNLMVIKGYPKWEAIWYIALIPMIMSSIIFFFLSKISRLELPCISIEERSNIEEQFFDLQEAVQVGVVFSLYMNSVIWIVCCIALRYWEVVSVLFVSIVLVPVVMGIIFIWVGRHFIEKSYAMYGRDKGSNFLNDHGKNGDLNSNPNMSPIALPEDGPRKNLIKAKYKHETDPMVPGWGN